jgi:mono/diheme cytochrome c family protein
MVGGAEGDPKAGPSGKPPVDPNSGKRVSRCRIGVAAQPIPARLDVMGEGIVPPRSSVRVPELTALVDSFCANCHLAPKNDGEFQYSHAAFAEAMTPEALKVLAKPLEEKHEFLAKLSTGELAVWLAAYLEQGKPATEIMLPREASGGPSTAYLFDLRRGRARTNIGECLPDVRDIRTTSSAAADTLFASAKAFTDLPKTLADTDLYTLDTEELARSGTFRYAVNYSLWSDDTIAERFVHVPEGKAIEFDPFFSSAFTIPENTRLYRTILKRVYDHAGKVGYRKLETQLILARPDPAGQARYEPAALFGTYVWNEAETEAKLHTDAYKDGTPFRDRLVEYWADERTRIEHVRTDSKGNAYVEYERRGVPRHHPVAGRHRCVKCHQGSAGQNFVLGFTPVQISRRPEGEGGIYDPVGADELEQVKRLGEYGVLKGAAQAFPRLEDPTPDGRRARNALELRAQAYALGNCAPCHSPTGSAASLSALNFTPGGLFQFPLAGPTGTAGRSAARGGLPYLSNRFSVPQTRFSGQTVLPAPFHDDPAAATKRTSPPEQLANLAPWESVFYRNVEAPYSYASDSVVYPRMPQSIAGFDCRAPEFFATWMLSIPTYLTPGRELWPDTAVEVPAAASDRASQLAREAAATRVRSYNRACIPALIDAGVVDSRPEVQRDTLGGVRIAQLARDPLPDGIPDAPNWTLEDFTSPAGEWAPVQESWKRLISAELNAYRPSAEFARFALSPFPYDRWRGTCDFSKNPRYEGPLRPWMRGGEAERDRIYHMSPGAAVYESICSQCHGERGDSSSNLAATLLELSGGRNAVSNFVSGLFGPEAKPLTHFEKLAAPGEDPEQRALAYFIFMAAGGTTTAIHPAVLSSVREGMLHGHRRELNYLAPPSGNMLDLAMNLCAAAIPADLRYPGFGEGQRFDIAERRGYFGDKDPRIAQFGERDLWDELCRRDNPTPIRVLARDLGKWWVRGLIERSDYERHSPLDHPVDPACFDAASDEARVEGPKAGLSPCPDAATILDGSPAVFDATRRLVRDWSERGARNAGAAAFYYLKQVVVDPKQREVPYDRCEQRFPAQ